MGIVNVTLQKIGNKLHEFERGDADNGLIQARTKVSNEATRQVVNVAKKALSAAKAVSGSKKTAIAAKNQDLKLAEEQASALNKASVTAKKEHKRKPKTFAQKHTLIVVSSPMEDQIQWRVVDKSFETIKTWRVKVSAHSSDPGAPQAFRNVGTDWVACGPIGYVRSGTAYTAAIGHHYEYEIDVEGARFDPNIFICGR